MEKLWSTITVANNQEFLNVDKSPCVIDDFLSATMIKSTEKQNKSNSDFHLMMLKTKSSS